MLKNDKYKKTVSINQIRHTIVDIEEKKESNKIMAASALAMNFTAIITFMALFNDYRLNTYAVISQIVLAIVNSVGIHHYNEYEKILKKVQRAINNGASDEKILELLKEESSDFQNRLIEDVNYFEEKKGIYR